MTGMGLRAAMYVWRMVAMQSASTRGVWRMVAMQSASTRGVWRMVAMQSAALRSVGCEVMQRTVLLALVAALAAIPANAQGGTEIYLAPIGRADGSLTIGAPANITRRAGYDNQPSFSARGDAIWFTSRRGEQTDIYQYDIAGDSAVQLTRTPESEYSPTLLPDESGFSVIRVERDSTQRLWRFALDGTRASLVLERIAPVGYHAWAGPTDLVLFVLGNPATLQRAKLGAVRTDTIVQNPGRSIHRVPGAEAVTFVHKKGADDWWIRRLDLSTGQVSDVVRTLPGSEDHVWTPDGVLLMAQGAALYAWSPGRDGGGWRELRRFTDPGLQQITRLSVSPDGTRIAFVSNEPE